ncbi:unnamed protein product [Pseudo-nitzschia multistriata]|uniref:Uncharacterized protein n=1 Tax=Pseudo-nitzschia multistriata TaxID=183589 RepID=A0A448Z1M4_9STRA|nr:unnamed protein product [Pseudo-nitzschia multistriata]
MTSCVAFGKNGPTVNHRQQQQLYHHQRITRIEDSPSLLKTASEKNFVIPYQPSLTARQLRRLRQDRLVGFSLMSLPLPLSQLETSNILRHIPEENEAVFCNDPPNSFHLDRVIQDIYKEIDGDHVKHKENSITLNNQIKKNQSDDGTVAVRRCDGDESGSSSNKVNIIFEDSDSDCSTVGQENGASIFFDSSISEISSRNLINKYLGTSNSRGNGPVDLDDSFSHDTNIDGEDGTGNEPVEDSSIASASSGKIDTDRLEVMKAEFRTIWKRHEDEFLVWKEVIKTTERPAPKTKVSTFRKQSYRDDSNHYMEKVNTLYGGLTVPVSGGSNGVHNQEDSVQEDSVTLVSCSSTDTFGYDREKKEEDFAMVENLSSGGSTDQPDTRSVTESVDLKSQATSRSLDTFGFSINNVTMNPLEETSESPNHNDANSFAAAKDNQHGKEQNEEDPIQSHYAVESDRCILRRQDKQEAVSMAAKARRLRTYRLRAGNRERNEAAKNANGPHRPIIVVDEEAKPRHCGMLNVVKVNINDKQNSCQSVISDLTNISEKLQFNIDHEPDGRWDKRSLKRLSVGEQQGISVAVGDGNNHGMIEVKSCTRKESISLREQMCPSVEEPELYKFDESVKTPPPYFKNSEIRAQLEHTSVFATQRNNGWKYSDESKWDDVSSIGLVGVETISTQFNQKHGSKFHIQSIRSVNPSIPFAIQTRPEEDGTSSDEELGSPKGICHIFRNQLATIDHNEKDEDSSASLTFSALWAEDDSSRIKKKEEKSSTRKAHPQLKLNPTFSTVFTEDCDSSGDSSSSSETTDVKMQLASRCALRKQKDEWSPALLCKSMLAYRDKRRRRRRRGRGQKDRHDQTISQYSC